MPALLRRVAASIEELGKIEVQDIVFHDGLDEGGSAWPHMTVYFDPSPDEESAAAVTG